MVSSFMKVGLVLLPGGAASVAYWSRKLIRLFRGLLGLEQCSICKDPMIHHPQAGKLFQSVFQLTNCKHRFHKICIMAFAHRFEPSPPPVKCPVCWKPMAEEF